MVDASISESIFNMLEACIPEYVHHGHVRPPSGSTISGAAWPACVSCSRRPIVKGLGCRVKLKGNAVRLGLGYGATQRPTVGELAPGFRTYVALLLTMPADIKQGT